MLYLLKEIVVYLVNAKLWHHIAIVKSVEWFLCLHREPPRGQGGVL